MHLSEYLILPPLRWSTVTLASCGTRQSWSTLPTTTRTAPSTPWATTPQTVATASPCSTAAPTGTFSPKGNTLTLDSVSHSLWWRCHFFHCWSQWWPLCFWVFLSVAVLLKRSCLRRAVGSLVFLESLVFSAAERKWDNWHFQKWRVGLAA